MVKNPHKLCAKGRKQSFQCCGLESFTVICRVHDHHVWFFILQFVVFSFALICYAIKWIKLSKWNQSLQAVNSPDWCFVSNSANCWFWLNLMCSWVNTNSNKIKCHIMWIGLLCQRKAAKLRVIFNCQIYCFCELVHAKEVKL